jgi:hypothetical protein
MVEGIYYKAQIDLIIVCGAWFGFCHEYGTYIAIFYTYVEIPM